jgi:hypothetical protein
MTTTHCDSPRPETTTAAGEQIGIPERDDITPAIFALNPPFYALLHQLPSDSKRAGLALLLLEPAVSYFVLQRFVALGILRLLRPELLGAIDEYLDSLSLEAVEVLTMMTMNTVTDLYEALPRWGFESPISQRAWCARRLELEWLAAMFDVDTSELDQLAEGKMTPGYGDALDVYEESTRLVVLAEFELADMFKRPTRYFYNECG